MPLPAHGGGEASQLTNDVAALIKLGLRLNDLERLWENVPGVDMENVRAAAAQSLSKAPSLQRKASVSLALAAHGSVTTDELVEALLADLEDPPDRFRDPIMLTLLHEPVVLSSGHIFDYSTVFDERGVFRFSRCPMTRQHIEPRAFPVVTIKKELVEYKLRRLDGILDVASKQPKSSTPLLPIAKQLLDSLGAETYIHQAQQYWHLRCKTLPPLTTKVLNGGALTLTLATQGVGRRVNYWVHGDQHVEKWTARVVQYDVARPDGMTHLLQDIVIYGTQSMPGSGSEEWLRLNVQDMTWTDAFGHCHPERQKFEWTSLDTAHPATSGTDTEVSLEALTALHDLANLRHHAELGTLFESVLLQNIDRFLDAADGLPPKLAAPHLAAARGLLAELGDSTSLSAGVQDRVIRLQHHANNQHEHESWPLEVENESKRQHT